MEDMRVLTVTSFGNTPEEDMRVTLSPMTIKMVVARDGTIQDRVVKIVVIMFLDSDPVELKLSDYDLLQLEQVVGSYGFAEM